jgi:hypothetical protein
MGPPAVASACPLVSLFPCAVCVPAPRLVPFRLPHVSLARQGSTVSPRAQRTKNWWVARGGMGIAARRCCLRLEDVNAGSIEGTTSIASPSSSRVGRDPLCMQCVRCSPGTYSTTIKATTAGMPHQSQSLAVMGAGTRGGSAACPVVLRPALPFNLNVLEGRPYVGPTCASAPSLMGFVLSVVPSFVWLVLSVPPVPL